MNNKVNGGNNKKIATIDSGGKDIKLQENSSVNEMESGKTQNKSEDHEDNRDGSSWFGAAAAVGAAAISVVTIAIKVYRRKTRLS